MSLPMHGRGWLCQPYYDWHAVKATQQMTMDDGSVSTAPDLVPLLEDFIQGTS